MNCDRRSPIVRLPQNMSARKTAQVLLGLPVPPKFDIARLRPEELARGERFETVADARARRDAELERFQQIAGLTEVADRLFACRAEFSLRRSELPNMRATFSAMAY